MVEPVRPGDLGALDDSRLAAAGEYTALAALVLHAGDRAPAMRELVAHAADEDAFRWAWALAARPGREALWGSFVSGLPPQLTVPRDLKDEVTAFVLAPWPPNKARTPRLHAQERLLGHLDPASGFARALARRALAPGAAPPHAVVEAALDVLGASSEPDDRALVITHVQRLPPERRPGALLRLAPPLREEEVCELLVALEELTHHPVPAPEWENAARLAARLPAGDLGDLLARPWGMPNNKHELLRARFVAHLGAGRLRELLEQCLGEEPTRALLAVVPDQLPLDQLGEIGRWAHAVYPAEWLEPIRNTVAHQLSFRARHGLARAAERKALLRALWGFALATPAPEPTALLAQHLRPGELEAPPDVDRSSPQVQRGFGRLAGHILLRDDRDAFEGELERLLNDLGEGEGQDCFLEGLAVTDAPSSGALPLLVTTVLLRSDAGIRAFAAGGHSDVLAMSAGAHPAAPPDPQAALRVLRAAGAALAPECADGLRRSLSWQALGNAYHEAIDALRAHPPVLFAELDRAVASLAGPEAAAAPAPALRRLLEAALDEGLRGQIPEETMLEHLGLLLAYPDAGVVELACRWVRRVDLDAPGVNTRRAELVLEADVAAGGRSEPLRSLRAELGERVAELADCASSPARDRAAHLRLAARVAPTPARAAALAIAGASISTELRREAADVLAETEPDPDHEEALRQLAEREPHPMVKARLDEAVLRIRSGSVGEALHNLARLVGLEPDPAVLRPEVLLPDPRWREAFVHWVDKARARVGHAADPGTFVEAAINLGERMVEEAVVARFDAEGALKGIKPEEVERLRAGLPSKPDVGSLLGRQALTQTFPWFASHSALRQLRGAHPTPAGQTSPLKLDAEDLVTAKRLLRTITAGWLEDMHETSEQRRSSATPGAGEPP